MVGGPEFLQTVGGGGGQPLATNASGTVETDNYSVGGAFRTDGSAYPYTLDPPEVIQELIITECGPDLVLDLVTKTGDQIDGFETNGATVTLDTVEIDSVTVKDPSASADPFGGMWVGE